MFKLPIILTSIGNKKKVCTCLIFLVLEENMQFDVLPAICEYNIFIFYIIFIIFFIFLAC